MIRHEGAKKSILCKWSGCGKRFRHAQNLVVHMRIHENLSPFECTEGCGQRFRTKGNMEDHARRHAGIR